MLVESEALSAPLLYLSLYLKARRDDYYALLSKVRFENGWEDWLEFFLDGVIETSAQAVRTAQRYSRNLTKMSRKLEALAAQVTLPCVFIQNSKGAPLRMFRYWQTGQV